MLAIEAGQGINSRTSCTTALATSALAILPLSKDAPMTLALTAAEIDALAKKAEGPFDYHLSTVFWKEADAQGISIEKAEAFRLIGSVLGFPPVTQCTRSVRREPIEVLKPSLSNKPHN